MATCEEGPSIGCVGMQVTKRELLVPEDRLRVELKKILASPGFFRAARMQRFLSFVVEGRLSGKHNSEDLKESVIGMAVFDRDAAYDPKSDPVVRVEARRLRSKLAEYYAGPGKEDEVRIDLPKGSYAPAWAWQTEPAEVVAVKRPTRLIVWLAAGLALAFILGGLLLYKSDWRSRFFGATAMMGREVIGKEAKIRSVAVLPFENLSSDARQEYLISGLTDEIIRDLAKVKGLLVISRTSTDCYRNTNKRLPEIARELHVDAIVEGSVESSGKRVRVTAELIRAATDGHLWDATYERDAADVFTLQTDIAEDIATQIGVTLRPTASETADHPDSREAYEAYLRGLYFWNKRTLDGLQKAISYYQRSIQLDPTYAKAYAGLADSYVLLSSYGGPSPSESLTHAQEAAQHALRLDNSLAEAYTALAVVKADRDCDWQGATREFERALQLSPSYPTARHWFALHLSRLNRHKEAEFQIERALQLDPLSLIINTDAAEVFYCARNPEKALFYLGRALELDPNFAEAHLVLGKVYEEQNDFARAVSEFELSNRLFGDAPNLWALEGNALARDGKRSQALAIAHKLERASRERYVSGVDIAMVYCALGDKDRAIGWLDKAHRNGGKGLNIIGSDPLFDGCRSDPRFAALLAQLGLNR